MTTTTGTGPRVGIIMGSDSDLPVMEGAARALDDLAVPWEMTIVSAHRTPERMYDYARAAAERGVALTSAVAGGAAHLPGMVASLTPLPVIGLPVAATGLAGRDALLSIVQMPAGIPVATVAIDNATNAGLLAARILGATDPAVRDRVVDHADGLRRKVEGKIERLEAKLRSE